MRVLILRLIVLGIVDKQYVHVNYVYYCKNKVLTIKKNSKYTWYVQTHCRASFSSRYKSL